MPGFRHSPLDDISRIRQDLRDRYQDGFPILKELLQNADDAGASEAGGMATRLVLVLAKDGLPGAGHPLLRTAGLAVLNDGLFTASDAVSITSLGMSNKAGQVGSAGKFGLGLKSIFHCAEAFFYFSPHTFAGASPQQANPSDLLNPWWSRERSEGRHRDWEDAWQQNCEGDLSAFARLVRRILSDSRWFGLWIPLRRPEHLREGEQEVKPIEHRFPSAELDELLGKEWRRRLLETLPLLRRLEIVRVCELDGESFSERATFCIEANAHRMGFGLNGAPNDASCPQPLSGTVQCETGRASACTFAGIELVNGLRELQEIRRLPNWPNQTAIAPDGSDLQVPEKAEPHGAVVLSRQSAEDKGVLRLQHAVFLPLGDPEEVLCGDSQRYSLTLHGYFFVDSGRRHIQPFDDLPENITPGEADTEWKVIKLWNRTLLREVVAPLVLPSLDAFVKREQMTTGEIEALVEAMQKTETLKSLRSWMCRGQRFVFRLQPGGGVWVHETWDADNGEPDRWIALPKPHFPESQLLELLPALKDLWGRATVSLKGKPCLADGEPARPNDSELAAMLDVVPVASFENANLLDYLLRLIPEDAAKRGPDSELVRALLRIANQLLRKSPPEDNDRATKWKEFFKRLPAAAFVRLSVRSSEVDTAIKQALGSHDLPVALLWADWHEARGDGEIPWANLLPVLQSLGALSLAGETIVNQRSAGAIRLLEACKDQPGSWPEDLARQPLFAWRPAGAQTTAASCTDIRQAHAQNRLFTSGDPWARDLAKAAPELNPALVESAVAKVLGLLEAACDDAACVRLLRRADRLAGDFASRKPLFDRLLTQAGPADGESWSALRCLLHGHLAECSNQVALFREPQQTDAFVKLAKLALEAAGQPWRLIPHHVASQLRLDEQQERILNLHDASAPAVEALLKEVGPSKDDCSSLSAEDCDIILLHFNDTEVLRGLNVHETLDERRVRIGQHAYVDDGSFTELPAAFSRVVTRIRNRTGYGRFQNQDGSNRLVNKLSWEAVIEIALNQPEPQRWCDPILTAIGRLGTLRTELCGRVRQVAWLPLAAGGAVKPADLLHVSGSEAELDRLPLEVLNSKVPLLRLAETVRNHERFVTFMRTVLPPARELLEVLAGLLKPHPTWSTGLSGEWSSEQVAEWVAELGNAPANALPVAGLVKALHSQGELCELLPGFLHSIGSQLGEAAYAEVLKHLAAKYQPADRDKHPSLEGVFVRYLRAIDGLGLDFARKVLASRGVILLSVAGEWKQPAELAPPTAGLSEHCVMANALACAMPRLVSACCENVEAPEPTQAAHDAGTWQAMADELRALFEPWRQFLPAPDPIGAFLCLLTSPVPVEKLAREFFHAHSQETMRQWFEQNHPGLLDKLSTNLDRQVPVILLIRGQTVRVSSVLGDQFNARRQDIPDRLILGGDPCVEVGSAMMVNGSLQPGPKRRLLRFLPLDPNTAGISIPEAVKCLQEAAEQLISRCTGQQVDLAALFQALCETAQVEVQVAQSLVVESALGLLRQIGGHASPAIKKALELWDKARVAEAEADSLGIEARRREAEEQRRRAKLAIRNLLQEDPAAQAALLNAVGRKLAQYQYAPASVPFELWQNADDAVCELEKLGDQATSAETDQFIASYSGDWLEALHFGRLVNQYRLPGRPSREDVGFKRDLEKMVVQSISDKTEFSGQQASALTGKFGLGFKSVFLVTNAPEVVSGSLDFVILGGIYPVRLGASQRDALFEELKRLAPQHWRRGTIIRLPLRTDGKPRPDEVMALFQRFAPLLVVFSRRLKRLRLVHEDEAGREMRWQPEQIADGIEVGELSGLDTQEVSRALVFTGMTGNDRVQLLLRFGSDGFVPLPEDVPTFWVTAPTRATPDYGFTINGPFEPDVGRVQLALNSQPNEQLADELARMLADRLWTLWQLAAQDWKTVRAKLRLASSATPNVFAESLWEVLGRRFTGKCPRSDPSQSAVLARRILWQSENSGLRRFYGDCAALPTGQWGEHRALTKLDDIRFVAAGALDRENVFSVASQWPAFRQQIRPGQVVSETHVASVLRRWDALVSQPEELHLATVVERELTQGQELRADPDTARLLGQLVTPDFLRTLKEGKSNEREEREHKALCELLPKVLFQAADGSWHEPAELVVADGKGVDHDEKMRAAFAPPEARLNPACTSSALAFFLACRQKLGATVETMAQWVLQAASETQRVAAVCYLLKGELHDHLGKAMRSRKDENNWLWQLADQPKDFAWFARCFSDDDLHNLKAYILRSYDDELRERSVTRPERSAPPSPTIWSVKQLWVWWERQNKPVSDYVLEGEANWPLFHGGPILNEDARKAELKRLLLNSASPEGKLLWYRFFGYACLVSAGRTVTELRRFWRERLEPEGFWTRTSAGDFSDQTRRIFEQAVSAEFNHLDAGGEQAYFWRRVFYDIRKVHQMVQNEFPAVLLDLVHQGHGEHLRQFLRTGHLPGPEQPRWIGTFGQSADTPLGFIIRELFRLGVIINEAVRPHAFYVCRPVLRALAKIGWISDWDDDGFSGDDWLRNLKEDPEHGPKLVPFCDIPLLHMGITYRGQKIPKPPSEL